LSLVGLFNNINQQNFGTEDLLGVTSSGSGGGGARGGGNRSGGNRGNTGNTGNTNNFLVGQQNGVSARMPLESITVINGQKTGRLGELFL
jgi:hypothetical protein